jgi:hypothetical protein
MIKYISSLVLDEPVSLVLDEPVSTPNLHGEGRNIMSTNELKLFVKQFNTFIKKNQKIKTMKQYVKHIIKNNTKFMKKTLDRAMKYNGLFHINKSI